MIRRRLLSFRSLSTLPLPISKASHGTKANLFRCNQKIGELGRLGRVEDARKLFDAMPQRDSSSWNSIISIYMRRKDIKEAKNLFDSAHGHRNVRTWTILLSGYAKAGLLEEAIGIFLAMPQHNVVSCNALLSGLVKNGDLKRARRLFDEMTVKDVSSWNSMITGYARSGLMEEARKLFDRMADKNSVSWMLMASGYAEMSRYREGWAIFVMMMMSGVRPDLAVLVVGFSVVTGLNSLDLIGCLRVLVIKTGYEGAVVVGTAILNAYSRCGSLDDAVKFFKAMPERNEYSLSSMIAAFSQCGRLDEAIALYESDHDKHIASRNAMMAAYMQSGRIDAARSIFDEMVKPDVVSWNAMVAGYAQNGMLEKAKDVFLRMPDRNAASWAAMIAGYAQNGNGAEGLKFFVELHRTGMAPSHSSFTSALSASANNRDVDIGRQLHSLAIKTRCQSNLYVGNGLLSMYAKCNKMADVSQVFNTMRVRDTASWNTLISGLSENCMLADAQNAFAKMATRDVVSWSAIISACVQAGKGEDALHLFLDMLSTGLKPAELTVTSLLSACGSLGATKLGEQFHALIFKCGLDMHLCVCNALITMYFKCGCLDGLSIFKQMPERDIITWNAVLGGCAQNGLGKEAIEIFKQMESTEVLPDVTSFLGVLLACSNAGLVDQGWYYFISMSQDYGIIPSVQDYTCMVDLLGRTGQLSEAEIIIQNMPVRADSVIWDALLSACKIHQNMELGWRVAERLFQMETLRYGTYVLLSHMYAYKGMLSKVEEIKQLMKQKGVTKEPGFSWIQLKNKQHFFHTEDQQHDDIEEIHLALKEFYGRFKASDYFPDRDNGIHSVDANQKENELLYHSEKLAIAYGILRTPRGVPIQITTNIRICVDCHSFMKFMAKSTQHKIIIRNGNRVHHIQDGLCSCGDYW